MGLIENILTYPIKWAVISISISTLWGAIAWENGFLVNLVFILSIIVLISPTVIIAVYYGKKVIEWAIDNFGDGKAEA